MGEGAKRVVVIAISCRRRLFHVGRDLSISGGEGTDAMADQPDWRSATAPGIDQIAALAHDTRDKLPDAFISAALSVAIRVEDFADEALLNEMEIGDPFELTGLYDGIPLTEKSVMDQSDRPDTIWLFRRPILDEWIAREDVPLERLVAHVYIHELAHHFGWSDEDIATIDRWWE